jgi:hypothetical protein
MIKNGKNVFFDKEKLFIIKRKPYNEALIGYGSIKRREPMHEKR